MTAKRRIELLRLAGKLERNANMKKLATVELKKKRFINQKK